MELFEQANSTNVKRFCITQGVPRSSFQRWLTRKDLYMQTTRGGKHRSHGGQGLTESITFSRGLVTFMKVVRRDEHVLTAAQILNWMKKHHPHLLDVYSAFKKNDRVAFVSKLREEQLQEIQATFAKMFWNNYGTYNDDEILNVDETGVYYDMPPRSTWALIGGSSKVDKSEKHSKRLTAVLTIRAEGKKLPILFIVNGKPGGPIETNEVPTYPAGHVYVVQKEAWMDYRVWRICLTHKFVVETPSVILADNLVSHVSNASVKTICLDLCSSLQALPPNSPSVCQPLDVGVMGLLKAKMRSLWLRETPVSTAEEKRMMMIKRTIAAFGALGDDVIVKSFVKELPRTYDL
ncbi:hypothetical protein DYB30_003180 [Aphanomyces astaci]|uniref:DDE-1 domain-containing protein n=1 Tax=Aphanomyces astaci TaxID=112090 RepID=A0A397CP62_APHAT|nr:hypothetical protein DYB30_003180 [Aphanomyces astaci]